MESGEDLPATAAAWKNAGHGVAIATVVKTWGSSPRQAGSQLIIRDDLLFQGSVSGGCVEGRVIDEAQDVIKTGAVKLLEFGVTDNEAWQVGLACGGRIEVFVEPYRLDRLIQGSVIATELTSGEKRSIDPSVSDPLQQEARTALTTDTPQVIEKDGRRWFVQPFNPPLKMFIVGAVHVTQPLVRMASELGYAVTVIDPRPAFVREERFAGVNKTDEWPDEALKRIGLDHRSALVLLSHDPKLDDPALEIALTSNAFYIGALGSKKTHEKRVERLTNGGHTKEAIARIHAPIGLDIGAKTPAEIAASIIAEVTATLRGRKRS